MMERRFSGFSRSTPDNNNSFIFLKSIYNYVELLNKRMMERRFSGLQGLARIIVNSFACPKFTTWGNMKLYKASIKRMMERRFSGLLGLTRVRDKSFLS